MVIILYCKCNPARRLMEGEALIWKNEVKLEQPKNFLANNDVLSYVRPIPNQKFLGVLRLKLGLHNLGDNGKDKKFRKWLMRIGEPPSLLDSMRVNRSSKQILYYLHKQGFFNGYVSDSISYINKSKTKAIATYTVITKKPYFVRQVHYEIGSARIKEELKREIPNSYLKPGQRYNYDLIDNERERLSNFLQNESYYAINKDFFYVEVDSNLNNHQVDLTIKLKTQSGGENNEATFKGHKFGAITIHCGINPYKKNQIIRDTLLYKGYKLIYYDNFELKPEIIYLATQIKPGDYYKKSNIENTYKRLSSIKYIGAINIQFEQTNISDTYPRLETNILLSNRTKHNFNLESRVTNRSGNLGISGSLVYGNKNIFKGGEIFEIILAGGMESQQIITDDEIEEQEGKNKGLFSNFELNTVEFGPELRLTIPKFLIPFSAPKFSKTSNPKTVFSAALNFQERPDYIRSNSTFSLSYEWNESVKKKHIIAPVEISVIKINNSNNFTQRLQELNDQLLINSYRDHLISAFRYSFIYNSQTKLKNRKQDTYLRANFESAGNIIHATNAFGLAQEEENYQSLFNIRYAQYIKVDGDFRKYFKLFNDHTLAMRLKGGMGIPQKNLNVLPFERSFFSGGANDLRAWQARTLGPGSYIDTSSVISFDKIGDFKLGASVEYRFNIFKYLNGAVFVDAGNVWLLDSDNIRKGGILKADKFVSEIAIGAGVGARLDFDFFIIRLDAATKLKDPKLAQGERWIYQPKTKYEENYNFGNYKYNVIWNLGIGYPF